MSGIQALLPQRLIVGEPRLLAPCETPLARLTDDLKPQPPRAPVPCLGATAPGARHARVKPGPGSAPAPLPGEGITRLAGSGDALRSAAGRFAKAQQRADPARSEHFGG